jgi:hypothetical protein
MGGAILDSCSRRVLVHRIRSARVFQWAGAAVGAPGPTAPVTRAPVATVAPGVITRPNAPGSCGFSCLNTFRADTYGLRRPEFTPNCGVSSLRQPPTP